MSLHPTVTTWKYHCSQSAVLGSQMHCPCIQSVLVLSILISSVLRSRDYRTFLMHHIPPAGMLATSLRGLADKLASQMQYLWGRVNSATPFQPLARANLGPLH